LLSKAGVPKFRGVAKRDDPGKLGLTLGYPHEPDDPPFGQQFFIEDKQVVTETRALNQNQFPLIDSGSVCLQRNSLFGLPLQFGNPVVILGIPTNLAEKQSDSGITHL
jgi:hypothetical protein